MAAILVLDDEKTFLDSVCRVLRIEGYEDVMAIADPREVAAALKDSTFDVALLDVTMPHMDGIEILCLVKEASPGTECIMLTANESVPTVVKAMRLGAYDYIIKPLEPQRLVQTLRAALERKRLLETLLIKSGKAQAGTLRKPEAFAGIVTQAASMIRLLHEAELQAASDIPVLVTGETGVGKELMARAIHAASRRVKGPFVAVNMLSLSMNLFESEFFGHVRGAFTGADRDKAGYLAQARGGTLFLDEIGDLPMEIQGKLLRILQEGEFTPVGRTRPELSDSRFVAATNQDLARLVSEGRFRRDLLYRLQFASLEIPPLRERRTDVRLLAQRFLERCKVGGRVLSEASLAALECHDWPGNVRELKAVVESASNLAEGGTIEPGHLRLPVRPAYSQTPGAPAATAGAGSGTGTLDPLADVEKRHILHVYEACGRNKTQAAKVLEIGLQTMHRKLRSYGV